MVFALAAFYPPTVLHYLIGFEIITQIEVHAYFNYL